jgi:hypothetical protein
MLKRIFNRMLIGLEISSHQRLLNQYSDMLPKENVISINERIRELQLSIK